MVLFVHGIIDFVRKVEPLEIIIKPAISFTLYLAAGEAVILFGIISIAAFGHDSEPFKSKHLFIVWLVILAYLGFGLFSSWFVRRDLVKTLRQIIGNNKKLQSIFSLER